MAARRDVLENFIIRLLKDNLINNYIAETPVVRKYYLENYRTIANCSFFTFYNELANSFILTAHTRKYLYFDQEWVTYISKRESVQKALKKKVFSETEFIDSERCQLCLVKFSNINVQNDHCNGIKHDVRVRYLKKKKGAFDKSKALKFRIVKVNEAKVDSDNEYLKLTFERKVKTCAKIKVTNISNSSMDVIEVVKVNPYQKAVKVQSLKKRSTLNSEENFTISLQGYFENSASFKMPIVVVCSCGKKQETKYFLQEIDVEVLSEFSNLKTVTDLQEPSSKKWTPSKEAEEIILGEMPVAYTSRYKEVLPLQSYDIPTGFITTLQRVMDFYPNFVERRPFNKSNHYFYGLFASMLHLPIVMTIYNYCRFLTALVNIEENQIRMDIRHYDTTSKLIHIGDKIFELEVPGLCEARPSLVSHDHVYVKVKMEDRQKYQGIVSKVFENSVHLSFSDKFKAIYNESKVYYIEFGYNRRPLKVQKQAIFLTRAHDIQKYFFPGIADGVFIPKSREGLNEQQIEKSNYQLDDGTREEPTVDPKEEVLVENTDPEITYFNPNLNEEQKMAVNNILNERDAPYLIFGPPGTGKTVTVVEAVLQIWKNKPESRILICTPSNSATNEIAIRLANELPSPGDVFRLIGNTYSQDKKLIQMENLVNVTSDGTFYMPPMNKILENRILLTTLVTAARLVNGGIPDSYYSHVFIDESGYATESESLIPIAGILSNSTRPKQVVGQVILAGDPRQLGPMVHSNFAKYCGYGKSMLERLLDTCPVYRNEQPEFVTKLVKNYRSHEAILKIPNELFYDGKLEALGGASSDIFTDWENLITPGFPVIFHHIVGEDGRENNSPSFFNIQEVEEVIAYLKKIVGNCVKDIHITEEDVGIVTPYRKQAQMLNKACEKQGWNNILVGSVEQFQGKEKLVILISTVRSKNIYQYKDIDKKCQLGFVRNPKRFNVALTRAKALLIVVGNGNVLKTDKNWLKFIDYCAENNSVSGQPFGVSEQECLEEGIENTEDL